MLLLTSGNPQKTDRDGLVREVPENLYTPAGNESEETGRQVPGWVYGISCVHAQGQSNDSNEDANHQSLCPLQCWIVLLVRDG